MRFNHSSLSWHNYGLGKPPLELGHGWLTTCHTLQWRYNERDGISNHQRFDCLHNRLFMRRSKETLKPRVTGLCAENSPVTGEFPAQKASNAENVSIWWRHHEVNTYQLESPLSLWLHIISLVYPSSQNLFHENNDIRFPRISLWWLLTNTVINKWPL